MFSDSTMYSYVDIYLMYPHTKFESNMMNGFRETKLTTNLNHNT